MAAGTVLQLDPELNLAELIQPRLKHLMLQRFSPRQVARKAAIALWHVANIVKNAPAQMRSAIRHLNRGQWQIKIQHQNLDRLARELDRSSNRLAFALIIASTIIGSSFILASDATDTVLGLSIRTYGIVGYVVAGIMGAGLVWAILRSGRLY
jgi:ubiquinone biosynthesis protein